MGRRCGKNLDEMLEAWARWCHSGGILSGHTQSVIAKLMDNKGHISFGSTGGQAPIIDSFEAKVEAAVMNMASKNLLRADVLRLEYGAGWLAVSIKESVGGDNLINRGQYENACALGLSVRTYRRHLAAARERLNNELGLNKNIE